MRALDRTKYFKELFTQLKYNLMFPDLTIVDRVQYVLSKRKYHMNRIERLMWISVVMEALERKHLEQGLGSSLFKPMESCGLLMSS